MPDHRVPVRFATASDAAGPDCVVVADAGARVAAPAGAVLVAFTSHRAGCACCGGGGRSPFAASLGRLFVERARGERPFFRRVVVLSDAAGLEAARDALDSDPLLCGRFRHDGDRPELHGGGDRLSLPARRPGGVA